MTFPARKNPFTMSKSASKHLLEADSDWQLVCKFLHWNGPFYKLLTTDEHLFFRAKADGFGSYEGKPSFAQTHIWDWSHVRDSSDAAIKRVADALKAWVKHYTFDW